MKKVKVGICRIYTVKKFTMPEAKEFCIDFALGDINVVASLGPQTHHEITGVKLTSQTAKNKQRQTVPAAPEEFSKSDISIGEIFCEILSTRLLEIDDDLADSFFAQNSKAKEEIFKIGDKIKQRLFSSLDYVAGFLDLHFDYVLTRTLVFEESYAYYNSNLACTPYGLKTNKIGSFEVNKNPDRVAKLMMVHHKDSNKDNWEKNSQILGWLLRAWSTRDRIHEFVSLFFIIERIIPKKLPIANINKWQEKRQKVLMLVKKHANPEELQEITDFVKGMKSRLSLSNRFESWAAHIALPGWREDATAFNLLNEKRNELINAAKLRIELRDILNQEDVRVIENIAIRYIRFALFGQVNIVRNEKINHVETKTT